MVQRKRKLKRSVVNFLVLVLIIFITLKIVNLWFYSVEHLRLDF